MVDMFSGVVPSAPAEDAPGKDPEAIGRQVEELFAKTLLKEMRRTTSEDGPFSSREMSMFMDFLDGHIAEVIAESGTLGMGDAVARALPSGHQCDGELPVHGATLTSGFGARRHPVHGRTHHHDGLDLAAPRGSAIHPVRPGTVVFAGERGAYGNVVEVRHDNGLVSRYAHCDRLEVREGQRVGQEDVLGTVGSTGRTTGPHLHLEIRDAAGKPQDPRSIFGWSFQK